MNSEIKHRHGASMGLLLTATLLLFFSNNSHALTTFTKNASISGTLTKPTCKFNLGSSQNIKFNDVDVTKIATGEYTIPIELKISCGTQSAPILLTLTATSGFDANVIKTTTEGLGIQIYSQQLKSTWQPNTSIRTKTQNNNNISATLISNSGADLKGGDFSAVANISAIYD
ncbi:fimbrial protein [Pseudomonas chlororaphis]|uniref:fimbrial protein n=1 Tax=Pseudomonas chlororaphis TaxID=587753 RepID=UPI00209BB932|nr:fimbrial protein [Pseudomonas chlororaphis]MCO7612766.1 fimbrial protein [Pseudomonas chlororaphis]